MTPMIQDDCSESPSIEITPTGQTSSVSVEDGVMTVFDNPIFGFNAVTVLSRAPAMWVASGLTLNLATTPPISGLTSPMTVILTTDSPNLPSTCLADRRPLSPARSTV